ncbi:MAG: SocA family protein [Candidatus Schmidhempelia sp.]|nr:SocA family protein [Candidatus Schmidhempelia sp.]
MFDERKSAQASAYLLTKAGGSMYHIKLIKLLYLADRLSFELYNYPITGDDYYSMKYGPVLSHIYANVNNYACCSSVWAEYISDKDNHQVSLINPKNNSIEDLDELSESDIEVLDLIYRQFGTWDRWDLVDYCHKPENIPEWKNIDTGSEKIELLLLLSHLGKSRETIEDIINENEYQLKFLQTLRKG